MGTSLAFRNVQNRIYLSTDAGRTWRTVASDSGYAGDPTCAIGLDSALYFVGLHREYAREATTLIALSSHDGGKEWHRAAIPRTRNVDRPFLTVDNTRGAFSKRVYVLAQVPVDVFDGGQVQSVMTLWRSVDGGDSFQFGARRTRNDEHAGFAPTGAVVLSDGTLVGLTQLPLTRQIDAMGPSDRHPTGTMRALASYDGGETFDTDITVDSTYGHAPGLGSLAADVASAVFRDRLYGVWSDSRGGDRLHIVLSYSSDKGKTWATPRIVDDDRRRLVTAAATVLGPERESSRDATVPAVAVNKDGVVGVVWHDRRHNAPDDSRSFMVRFAASFDGGETFGPSAAVSYPTAASHDAERLVLTALDAGARRLYAGVPKNGIRMVISSDHWPEGGHTNGLAADANGMFHALWVDGRSGIHQVWTATITVSGKGIAHGAADLAALDDVSKAFDVEVSSPTYDETSGAITVVARLRNASADSVNGPLALRVTTIASDIGTVRPAESDNGVLAEGAVWWFEGASPKGRIAPGERSAPRTLRFQMRDALSKTDYWARVGSFYPGILSLDGVVLARGERH